MLVLSYELQHFIKLPAGQIEKHFIHIIQCAGPCYRIPNQELVSPGNKIETHL